MNIHRINSKHSIATFKNGYFVTILEHYAYYQMKLYNFGVSSKLSQALLISWLVLSETIHDVTY